MARMTQSDYQLVGTALAKALHDMDDEAVSETHDLSEVVWGVKDHLAEAFQGRDPQGFDPKKFHQFYVDEVQRIGQEKS